MTKAKFPDEVLHLLIAGGWMPGRKVKRQVREWLSVLEGEFTVFPAAVEALLEYGGIAVHESGPGIDRAREPFVLDPTLALEEADRFNLFAHVIGKRLFPLGEGGGGHFFIAIADDGSVYSLMDSIHELGDSVPTALSNLVLGKRDARHLA